MTRRKAKPPAPAPPPPAAAPPSPAPAPDQRSRGRPTKLTQDLIARIVKYVRAGNYVETAAGLEGISKDTLYDWLKKGAWYRQGLGRGGSGPRDARDALAAEFSDAVQRAEAEAEARGVLLIEREAQKGNLKALFWRMERRFGPRWARRERIDVAGVEGAPPIVIHMWQPGQQRGRDGGVP